MSMKHFVCGWHWLACATLIACQPEAPTRPKSAAQTQTMPSNAAPPTQLASASNPQQRPVSTDQHIAAVMEWENLSEQSILAPADGSISQLLVVDGQTVNNGQYLAQLKVEHTTTLSAPHVSTAAKNQAYQKWQQDKKLFSQGFISQAALAKSEAVYRLAAKPHAPVQPTTRTSTPEHSWVQAPFNGIIKPLAVSTGNKVKNGQQLFQISPLSDKRLKLVVAQENHIALKVGQRIHITGTDTDIWLQISELPPTDNKQYTVAYALWPSDLALPELNRLHATIIISVPVANE